MTAGAPRPPAWWPPLAAGIAFPGRARVVGALAGSSDHGDAGPGEALLLAAGIALAEDRRGGAVACAVGDADAAWWRAAAVAARLAPASLVLAVPPGLDRQRLAGLGWRVVERPQAGGGPQAAVGEWGGGGAPAVRREWQPVRLAGIPAGLAPPWPPPGPGSPWSQVDAALAWLAEREPALWLAPAWAGGPALGLATEGRRVVWRCAPGTAPDAAILERAGRLQAPLLVVADAAALGGGTPPGWWRADPRDAGTCAGALAWMLGDEAPWLLALPPALAPATSWPPRGWEPD